MKWWSVVAVLLLLLGFPAEGMAQEKVRAREAYRRASQHYKLGEYQDALTGFKEAYRHFEDPSFLFNVGQCYRMLGDKREAIRTFKTFLSELPHAPNRHEVTQMISSLQTSLNQEEAAKSEPPQGTMAPPLTSTEPVTAEPTHVEKPPTIELTKTPEPPEPTEKRSTPTYKKWWVWTTVAVVVVGVGLGVGLGLGLSQPSAPGNPKGATSLGSF